MKMNSSKVSPIQGQFRILLSTKLSWFSLNYLVESLFVRTSPIFATCVANEHIRKQCSERTQNSERRMPLRKLSRFNRLTQLDG